MKTRITHTLGLAAIAAFAGFAITGCITKPVDDPSPADGSSGFITQEATSMGTVVVDPALAKSAVEAADTGEVIVQRLHLDTLCQPGPCFVRSAQFTFTNSNGKTFTRERQDTIWLDSVVNGVDHYLNTFRPLHATTIIHHRQVSKIKGDVDVEIQFNTTLTWVLDSSGSKTGALWSGTIVGTFNGDPFTNVSFNGVTRPVLPGLIFKGFGFPTNGFIHCKRGKFAIDIHFKGAGKAEVDVTNTDNGREHHIECDGGQENQIN